MTLTPEQIAAEIREILPAPEKYGEIAGSPRDRLLKLADRICPTRTTGRGGAMTDFVKTWKLNRHEAHRYADQLRAMARSKERRALLAQELEACSEIIRHQGDALETKDTEIERVTAANQMWLDKWERLQCEWCGTSNVMKDGDHDDLG